MPDDAAPTKAEDLTAGFRPTVQVRRNQRPWWGWRTWHWAANIPNPSWPVAGPPSLATRGTAWTRRGAERAAEWWIDRTTVTG